MKRYIFPQHSTSIEAESMEEAQAQLSEQLDTKAKRERPEGKQMKKDKIPNKGIPKGVKNK